jgi:hypothetical protein
MQQRGAGRLTFGMQRAGHQEDEHRVGNRVLQRTGQICLRLKLENFRFIKEIPKSEHVCYKGRVGFV